MNNSRFLLFPLGSGQKPSQFGSGLGCQNSCAGLARLLRLSSGFYVNAGKSKTIQGHLPQSRQLGARKDNHRTRADGLGE